jgi:O-antigen/teichoic acid export membrane protein
MSLSLSKQAGLLTAGRALGQILTALAGLVVVRALTQHDYGTYRQLILIYTSVYLIGDAAFAQSLYHFVPRERERARVFLGQAMLVTFALAGAWFSGLVLLEGSVAQYFGNPDVAAHLRMLGIVLALNLLTKIPEVGLVTLGRVGASALNIAIFESLKFVMIVLALKWRGTIDAVLAAMALATGLRMAAQMALVGRDILFTVTPRIPEQFYYSMSLWLPGLFNNFAIFAHQFIVGHIFTPSDYAIYAVACFKIPLLAVITTSAGEVLLVRAAEQHAQGQYRQILAMWRAAVRKAQLILLPAAIGLAFLAKPFIVALFTARYTRSAGLFIPIVLTLPLGGFFADAILRAYHAQRAYAAFYVLRATLALALGVAGATIFGLWGAALSSLAALGLVTCCQVAYVSRLLGERWTRAVPWPELGRMLLLCVACGAGSAALAPWMARPLLHLGPWFSGHPAAVQLGCGIALFAAVYVALVPRLRLLAPEELDAVFGGIRSRFPFFFGSLRTTHTN